MRRPLPVKDRFELPPGVIYLDGNSLGPRAKAVSEALRATEDAWATHLIGGWNDDGWMALPRRTGDRLARLVGAAPGTVVVGDTLSIQVYQALSAALRLRPTRRIILTDTGNFPGDAYVAQGLIATLGGDYTLKAVAPDEVADALDEQVAVLMLTEVDYRTGRRHAMVDLTQRAHAAGALTLWDLAHSAGAVALDLEEARADFAVGCTYKFLNGGPGAPAYIYVRPDLVDAAHPSIRGWLGHAAPFDFDAEYRPAASVERFRIGTPAVLQMAALNAALTVWDDIDMAAVDAARVVLSERLIEGVRRRCPALTLVSPRDPLARGSQVSFAFEEGYALVQALIARGVVGDFRAPNIVRLGMTPLYLDESDIDAAVDAM
ncbi:MAG: kynureninase, partial [Myxococcota bacterium]